MPADSGALEATPTRAAPASRATGLRKPPDVAVVGGSDPRANARKALALLGGIERFVKRGDKVVIKPNLTWDCAPEYAVTTNPDLVGALVSMCVDVGAADVTVFDKGGRPQKAALRASGIGAAVTKAGGRVKILTDDDYVAKRLPRGRLLTSWPLVRDVFDADVLINAPIAKHHDLAGLTMAMKNLMGVMGGDRSTMHDEFAQRIVDLNTLVRADLTVLDAHRILIRNGPISDDLADVRMPQKLVAGTNAVSVDAYGTTLFGMSPRDLPYLIKAHQQGLGEIDLARMRIAENAS